MFRGPILECGAFVLQGVGPHECEELLVRISSRDHPHECGAGFSLPGQLVVDPGSPPRMWGRLVGVRACHERLRFTPTYVGPVIDVHQHIYHLPVHPHVCGAGLVSLRKRLDSIGSPPRMWGRCSLRWRRRRRRRFTPTYVGPVRRRRGPTHPGSVHPHVCGAGQPSARAEPRSVRFTPTYVGPVTRFVKAELRLPGSPPRMWGRFTPLIPLTPRRRFTPTYVGPVSR